MTTRTNRRDPKPGLCALALVSVLAPGCLPSGGYRLRDAAAEARDAADADPRDASLDATADSSPEAGDERAADALDVLDVTSPADVSDAYDAAPDARPQDVVTDAPDALDAPDVPDAPDAAVAAPGTLDPTFGPGATIPGVIELPSVRRNATGNSVAVGPSNTLLVAGAHFTSDNWWQGGSDTIAWRVLTNGAMDTTFGAVGAFYANFASPQDFDFATTVLRDHDGALLLGYRQYEMSDRGAPLVSRVNSAGSLDEAFGTRGRLDLPPLRSEPMHILDVLTSGVALDDGSFWLAGFSDYGPDRDHEAFLQRISATGARIGGYVRLPAARSRVAIFSIVRDGRRLVAAGSVQRGMLDSDAFVARFDETGVLDPTFGEGGFFIVDASAELGSSDREDVAHDVAVLPDGSYVAVGWAGHAFNRRPLVLRIGSDGVPSPWPGRPSALLVPSCEPSVSGSIAAVAVDSRGNIFGAGACGLGSSVHEFAGDTTVFAMTMRGVPIDTFGNGPVGGRFRMNLGTDADEPLDTAQDVALDEHERVVVVGGRRTARETWRAYALRLNAVP